MHASRRMQPIRQDFYPSGERDNIIMGCVSDANVLARSIQNSSALVYVYSNIMHDCAYKQGLSHNVVCVWCVSNKFCDDSLM